MINEINKIGLIDSQIGPKKGENKTLESWKNSEENQILLCFVLIIVGWSAAINRILKTMDNHVGGVTLELENVVKQGQKNPGFGIIISFISKNIFLFFNSS